MNWLKRLCEYMHGQAACVSLEVWLCHSTPFHSQARCIAKPELEL